MNRKICLYILVLIFSLFSAFAKDLNQRFKIGTGNDKFTYGLSKNDDDKLTFSFNFEYVINDFSFKVDLDALTDRGSWYKEEQRSGRLDVISTEASYMHRFYVHKLWSFNVGASLGFKFAGKMNFDFVQNFNHKTSGISPVELEYDWNKIRLFPKIGGYLETGIDVAFLHFGVNIRGNYAFDYSSDLSTAVEINAFNSILSIEAGYAFNKNLSESQTVGVVTDVMSGAFSTLRIDAGPYLMSWKVYPHSGFGYGTYYVDVMPIIQNKHNWKESDICFDYGFTTFYGNDLLKAAVKYPITDKLTCLGEVSFVSGFPITENEQTLFLQADGSRLQRNYGLYEVGLSYNPVKWYVSPFVQFQLGMGIFQLVYLNNSDPQSHGGESLPKAFVFSTDLRVGINALPDGFLSFGNSSYQIQFFGGTHFIPYVKDLISILEKDKISKSGLLKNTFSPYIGFGVSIGIDLLYQ